MTQQAPGRRSRVSRTWLRTPAFFAVVTATSGLLGLLVALAIGAPLGADHSCPSGAAVAACHYPPDVRAWLVSWGLGGVLLGLVVATVVAGAVGVDRPYRRPQKHLLVQGPRDGSPPRS